MARKIIVYHGTLDTELDPTAFKSDRAVHVGTYRSARQRLHQLVDGHPDGDQQGAIHKFEMLEEPGSTVYADPMHGLFNSDDTLRSRRARRDNSTRSLAPERPDRVIRPVQYVNEYEDPGSTSYVVMPHHLRHMSTQFLMVRQPDNQD